MLIRQLGPGDAEKYRTIRLEALKAHPEAFGSSYEEEFEYTVERFEKRFREGSAVTFGAFDYGNLVGTVTLLPETKLKTRHRANIVAMYVAPSHRRDGVGSQLMKEAIGRARELGGVSQIYLAVTSTNIPAKKLYESMGFVTYGVDRKALKVEGKYISEDLMVLEF